MKLFIAVFLVIWLVTMAVWSIVTRAARTADMDRMKNRLMGTASDRKKKKGAKQSPTLIQDGDKDNGQLVLRALGRFRYYEWAQQLLEQAGLKWKPGRLAHACLGMMLAGFAACWYLGPAQGRPFAPLAALAAGSLPLLFVFRARRSRLFKFESQFPESLEFVARSMRAGHAFSVSLEMIHREFPEPLSGEFRRTFEEHNLGLPIETALLKLSKRVPSMDVHFFVSAVLLQRRTGGNLAEILDKLASLIRERFKLRGKIRAISAHGRMTGMALTCIPVAVALMLFYVNPDYGKFFVNDPIGQGMAGAAVFLQLLGYGVIKKIVSIEV
ncbi:MAG: type II secretion system F family protein [Bryobacteraceae bacterium]|nr:type II secretion system F family protein [Bryobacteraceae bacterium]